MREELFNEVGKRLPYRETRDYVDNLVQQATESAITRHSRRHRQRHLGMMMASAAAVALLVVGVAITVMHHESPQPVMTGNASGPLDEFLNTLSDEEAAQLPYYEIEEIPEY